MKRWWLKAVALMLAITLAACTQRYPQGISIEGAWVRSAPLVNGNGAAYMEIRNGGPDDDRLIAVESDVAETGEVHQTMHHGDTASMEMVSTLDLPVNGKAVLEPGGYHIMLLNLNQPLKAGDQVMLILIFENAGEVQIQAEVRDE